MHHWHTPHQSNLEPQHSTACPGMWHALLRKKKDSEGDEWSVASAVPAETCEFECRSPLKNTWIKVNPRSIKLSNILRAQPPSPRFYSSQQGGSLEPGSRKFSAVGVLMWSRHHNWKHAKAHGVIWDLTSWLGIYPGVLKMPSFIRVLLGRVLLTQVTHMLHPWFINDVSKMGDVLSSKGSCISKPSRPNHRDSTHDAHK